MARRGVRWKNLPKKARKAPERSRGEPFTQPEPFKIINDIPWFRIELPCHRPYTSKGPRKAAENGIYIDMIGVRNDQAKR